MHAVCMQASSEEEGGERMNTHWRTREPVIPGLARIQRALGALPHAPHSDRRALGPCPRLGPRSRFFGCLRTLQFGMARCFCSESAVSGRRGRNTTKYACLLLPPNILQKSISNDAGDQAPQTNAIDPKRSHMALKCIYVDPRELCRYAQVSSASVL